MTHHATRTTPVSRCTRPGRDRRLPGLRRAGQRVLQGYYTPIFSDIADHLSIADADVNWFEAAQLIVSALVVPPLARLGDMVGHKKVLLLSTAVTALGIVGAGVRAGLHDVPHRLGGPGRVRRVAAAGGRDHLPRTAGTGRQDLLTRRAAGILVGALELAVIIGALTSRARSSRAPR